MGGQHSPDRERKARFRFSEPVAPCPAVISLSDVAKEFGDQTLFEGVTLQLDPGQRYGVVGANGSGKSTLLKLLSGEESPSRGEVSIPRRAMLGPPDWHRTSALGRFPDDKF